ncbi:MAG: hypothetical protein ACI9Y7_002994 [Dokdonia sp.]|jgi:hypothetical protein
MRHESASGIVALQHKSILSWNVFKEYRDSEVYTELDEVRKPYPKSKHF